jgi:hypothetical protein
MSHYTSKEIDYIKQQFIEKTPIQEVAEFLERPVGGLVQKLLKFLAENPEEWNKRDILNF